MIVLVFHILVRTHKGRTEPMHFGISFIAERELDNVELVVVASFLGVGAVIGDIEKAFLFYQVGPMMFDPIVIAKILEEDSVKLFLVPVV